MYDPNAIDTEPKTPGDIAPQAPFDNKADEKGARTGALHAEIRQLRETVVEERDKIKFLTSENERLVAAVADAERRRDESETLQLELAKKVANFETIDKGAEQAITAMHEYIPDIPLTPQIEQGGPNPDVDWGKVLVREERDEDGALITPGIFGFRRRVSFEGHSSYSRDTISGLIKSVADVMLLGDWVGPFDPHTLQPSFLLFPPLFVPKANGEGQERAKRYLDVIVLVR